MALDDRVEPLLDTLGESRDRVLLFDALAAGDTIELVDSGDRTHQTLHVVGLYEKSSPAIDDDLCRSTTPV